MRMYKHIYIYTYVYVYMCGVGLHAQNWREYTILGACHRSVTVMPHTYQ